MRGKKKIWARIIAWCLIAVMLPISSILTTVEAATTDTKLQAALTEAKTFIDDLTINNSSNNPSSVVSTWGSEFTWDNEKRESNKKSYLFEWSYYNGVVFEGLDYIYDVTEDSEYSDYVEEYLSTMITSSGTWATCSGSSKECAGYNASHGADCYKTASLLLDYYNNTGDGRYLTMANTLYTDLQNAQSSYASSDRGGNYNHTWSSTPTYAVWLDGIYMIQPFMAEYAAYANDTVELNRIAERFAWVGKNMYNESTGLYYHAANSSTSYYNNNGSYWGRAIGWYAAAMVDVMDYMTGDNLTAMQTQFKKLVDGMLPYQTDDGMWRQFVNVSTSTKETSVTALMAYAIQKAVNNGWLDSSYAIYAQNAFVGMCDYALDDSGLHYICFKGSTSSYSDPTYSSYVNEGKGVGPFIMAYAEMVEAQKKAESDDSEEETTVDVDINGTTITVAGVSGSVTGAEVTEDDKTLIEEKSYEDFIAYDLSATLADGEKATVSIPVPDGWDTERLIGISVEDGTLKEIVGTYEDGTYTFSVEHFSAKGVALLAEETDSTTSVSGTGNLVGGTVYTLDTDGVTASKNYLIVNTGSDGIGYALTNNGSNTPGSTEIKINDKTITVSDDTKLAWVFNGSTSGTVKNDTRYLYLDSNAIISTSSRNIYINNQNNGAYWLYKTNSNSTSTRYLTYSNGSWSRNSSASSVYLYEYTSTSSGEAVTFTVTPGSTALAPEATVALTGTVTVADETVDLSDCTIAWASSNTAYATVSDGTVTGVADGTTNITATLSVVNGTALQENIVLTIPVTVQSKTVTGATLTGNTPVTTKQNVEPDFSNIKLEVTYDDGTTGTITVDNGLVIEGYDITTIGYSYAKISYLGKEYGTVRVTVEGDPYEGLEEATDYPEYPEDGAVRIDKTATANADTLKNTGVTHVELDVAGISVKKAVDVVLVVDVSNSMAWNVENLIAGKTEYNACPGDGQISKLDAAMDAASKFANILLEDNSEDGTAATDNTVSFVTFAGYDAENSNNTSDKNTYIDSVMTVFTGETDASKAVTAFEGTTIAPNSGNSAYILTVTDNEGKQVVSGANRGNTNYDYAFAQAEQAVKELQGDAETYANSGRETYVVFMTDGAPSHYNKQNAQGPSGRDYIYGTTNTYTYSYTTKDAWTTYIRENTNSYATDLYSLVDGNFYAVGFDLAHGGFSSYTWDEDTLKGVLENMVKGATIPVTLATDEVALTEFYKSLATQIKYAGTSAQVTDIIDSEFTLQMAATSGSGEKTATLSKFNITPKITVTAYDLYTKNDTTDSTLIGTRKGTSEVLETVTFNEAGTEAYSDKVENGTKNIMSTATDGTVTIEAHYFTYTKTPEGVETFKWTIGNITDKEIVLGFDVYLKDSLEGGCSEGIYYTNEKATLEYIDINGKYATQTFPVPAVSWGGASTTIRFYLVNEKGEPVNRAGEVVPLANCIYVGEPVTVTLNLNADATIDAQVIEAAAYVPSEYYLYDINASYTVQTASGDDNSITGGIAPSVPSEDASKTAGGKTQTGAQTTIVIAYEATYYTYSTVGFGVRYDLTQEETTNPLVGDKIVIDYGKAINVDVLGNDPVIDGYKRELTGFIVFNSNTDTSIKQLNAGASTYTSNNGTYKIVDQKVQFQLDKMLSEVERVFYVVKYTNNNNTEDYYYLFGELDIIPATSVYYETDFAENVFTVNTTGDAWSTKTDVTTADGPQDDGTVGNGQTYGYDSTYENDAYLSNGSSLYVEGQGYANTYVTFSFTGTGFDLISRTGVDQGLIKVQIYSDSAMSTVVKTVTVLNKSEAEESLELYQIPVVSVNDLTYGTYYVKVSVNTAYSNETYPTLNRGNQFYFDAIRIFDPAKGNTVAEAAYDADGEANRVLTEVRSLLLSADDFNALSEDESTTGIVFVDRPNAEEGSDENEVVQVSTYEAIGPNNEVYLNNGQAIAFKITADNIPASIDVGAKSITGGVAELKAVVTDESAETYSYITKTIASRTAQNINLMNDATKTAIEDGFAYVIMTNTGDGVLSITDIKVAYTTVVTADYGISLTSLDDEIAVTSETEEDPYAVSYTVDAATFSLAKAVLTATEDVEDELPEEEEPEVTPNYDILSASITTTGSKNKKKTIITVETTQDVVELKITEGRKNAKYSSMEYEDQEDGTRIWTIVLSNSSNGNKTYTITGYGEDGTSGTSTSVENKSDKNNNNNKNNKH